MLTAVTVGSRGHLTELTDAPGSTGALLEALMAKSGT